jgi:hypothetical protein
MGQHSRRSSVLRREFNVGPMRRSGINESSHAGPKSRGSAATANISKTEHDALLIGGADPGGVARSHKARCNRRHERYQVSRAHLGGRVRRSYV